MLQYKEAIPQNSLMAEMFLTLHEIQIDAVLLVTLKQCACVFGVCVILYVLMYNMTDVQHVIGTLR